MSTPTPSDVMTLAGLALANGPWLAVRLRRLAEHSGQPLPEAIIESAVLGSSRVLAEVIAAEGRPAVSADHQTDPAALQGREQAQAHRQAGLDMPGSLRVLRLLRRDFDDLVRESWVDKDSRARAHEDVERFFERMLIGHFLAWAGSVAPPPPSQLPPPSPSAAAAAAAEVERLSGLLAQRESELGKAMDAVRQASSSLRKSRERARTLAAEISQAQAWAKTQVQAQEALKAELEAVKARAGAGADAALQGRLEARLDALQASAKAQEAQRAELEERLAVAQSALGAQREVEEAREMALREIDSARAEAEAAREELRRVRDSVQEAVDKAEGQALLAQREVEEARAQARRDVDSARAEAEAAREELRRAHEAQATLASEAEAMRLRLSETGSRMAEARQEEEGGLQARLAQVQERASALEAKLREARQNIQGLNERLAEQESLHAFKDERMGEQSRAVLETQELLVRLGATKDEIISRAQAAEAGREQMQAERDKARAELKKAQGELAAARKQLEQAGAARAEADTLSAELARVRPELAAVTGDRDVNVLRIKALETERSGLAVRLEQTEKALERAAKKAQAAAQAQEAGARLLAAHLAQTLDAVATVDPEGAVAAWNQRFLELFGLAEADGAAGFTALLPRLAARLERPEPWLERVRELLAAPDRSEEGQTLASTTGQTLVFRSRPAPGGGRLFTFCDVSLEHDMEHLVREIEGITRSELGQSLTAFIHLPQELLDDPAITPEQADKLTVIRDSGYRIVNTVNMAVDIFRMERGLYQMPQGSTLDLAVVARRAARDADRLASSRHVDLQLLLGDAPLPIGATLPGPGYAISAHALALNLLRDALEAAPRQSSIQAVLRADEAAGQLCLDITRPGTLSAEEQVRYFDKPVGPDARNGLARARYASRLIAASLRGSLSVGPGPQGGTTLSLRLPKA
ncbi:MAG: PAS-domain containing protein [Proteobacteria bacterium]|nr:PAS-domain containing protein [Pseudomonadota bacterium]MBU1594872.1 PAS-domain containing protein [Pseudomonadota bacterium]